MGRSCRATLRCFRTAAACGAAVVLLVALPTLQLASAQEVTPVFVVPTAPVAAGGPVSVWLAVLNASDRPMTYTFPGSLETRLRSTGAERSVPATLRRASEAGETIIPGYGESLLRYNERTSALRFGFALFR